MKLRILLSILVLTAFFANANSQVTFIENFDYPAGDSIGAHGWTSFSGSVNNLKVVSPGLTYTGYPLSGIGNACRVSNNGIDAYKNMTDSTTTGSVYVSFMVKIDTAKTGDYFLALLPQSSTTAYTPRIYCKDSSGTISFGISKSSASGGPIVYGANGYAYGTTYLVVAKYTFNTGSTTDDVMNLYVFTSPNLPSTEPSTPYVGPVTGTANDANSIGRIAIRQGTATSAPSLTIDGIKGTKSWASITTSIVRNELTAGNFELSQNYPNPFNPVTNIKFALPTSGFVNLNVYDITGKEVNALISTQLNAGVYTVNFNGANLSSGTYIYKLIFKSVNGTVYNDIKKLMLVK